MSCPVVLSTRTADETAVSLRLLLERIAFHEDAARRPSLGGLCGLGGLGGCGGHTRAQHHGNRLGRARPVALSPIGPPALHKACTVTFVERAVGRKVLRFLYCTVDTVADASDALRRAPHELRPSLPRRDSCFAPTAPAAPIAIVALPSCTRACIQHNVALSGHACQPLQLHALYLDPGGPTLAQRRVHATS